MWRLRSSLATDSWLTIWRGQALRQLVRGQWYVGAISTSSGSYDWSMSSVEVGWSEIRDDTKSNNLSSGQRSFSKIGMRSNTQKKAPMSSSLQSTIFRLVPNKWWQSFMNKSPENGIHQMEMKMKCWIIMCHWALITGHAFEFWLLRLS